MGDLLQRLSEEEREKARETSMPDWMDPMLAKLTHDYFSGEDWVFERKLDGERINDHLRHPRYKGLRRDKNPEDVHKEAESQVAEL